MLHTIHLLTFVLLFATGLLLLVPNLRAAVTGGYSLMIRNAHRWGGVAFALLPALLVLRFGTGSLFAVPDGWTIRTGWQAFHVGVTVFMGVVFTVTGAVLWLKRAAPAPVVDVSQAMHDGLTYVAAGLLALHVCEIGVAAVVARIKAAMGPARQET